MRNLLLILIVILFASCKERNTIENGLYKEGDVVKVETETLIIASEPIYEYGNTYYYVRTLNCDTIHWETCAFKVIETELTRI